MTAVVKEHGVLVLQDLSEANWNRPVHLGHVHTKGVCFSLFYEMSIQWHIELFLLNTGRLLYEWIRIIHRKQVLKYKFGVSKQAVVHAFKVTHDSWSEHDRLSKIRTNFLFFFLLSPPSFMFCSDLRVSRPLIVPGYPENTTGVVGGQAKLVCKVHRPASTKVQWLKTEASVPGRSQGGTPRLRALTVRTDDRYTQSVLCDCVYSVLIILKR